MSEIKSYYDLRADLTRLAEEENKQRLALVELQKEKTATIMELVRAAEKLLPEAVDEGGPSKPTPAKADALETVYTARALMSKRACSICRKPGHRATTCPEAHLHRQEQRTRKPRKPLSEERKEALRKQLEKARAKRRKA